MIIAAAATITKSITITMSTANTAPAAIIMKSIIMSTASIAPAVMTITIIMLTRSSPPGAVRPM